MWCDRKRLLILFVIMNLLALGLGGCGNNATDSKQRPEADQLSEKPLTDHECKEFAKSLEGTVTKGDAKALNELFDLEALLDRATSGLDLSPKDRQDFLVGAKAGVSKGGGIGPSIIRALGDEGSYKFLRIHTKDDRKQALFRLLQPENRVTYHDFLLVRRSNGRIGITDVYFFSRGEFTSQSIRRMLPPRLTEGQKARPGGLDEFLENTERMRQMSHAIREGRHQEALDTFNRLPPTLKTHKDFMLLRVEAAKELNDQEYLAAVESFRAQYPDDLCIDLLSIDYYRTKKRFPEALLAVDRFEKAIGGDPFLHVLRGSIHLEAGELPAARQAAQKAITQEPMLEEAYWAFVSISLREKNFEETLKHLRMIDEKFKGEFADFKTLPDYAEFVKSPQYQKWLESRK